MKDGWYRLKTWVEMELEFKLDVNGNIKCKFGFVPEMEQVCPEDRIIHVVDNEWISEIGEWNMSTDMVSEYYGEERPA